MGVICIHINPCRCSLKFEHSDSLWFAPAHRTSLYLNLRGNYSPSVTISGTYNPSKGFEGTVSCNQVISTLNLDVLQAELQRHPLPRPDHAEMCPAKGVGASHPAAHRRKAFGEVRKIRSVITDCQFLDPEFRAACWQCGKKASLCTL